MTGTISDLVERLKHTAFTEPEPTRSAVSTHAARAITRLEQERAADKALLEEAERALEPFADALSRCEPDAGEIGHGARPTRDMPDDHFAMIFQKLGDLRAARTLLTKLKESRNG